MTSRRTAYINRSTKETKIQISLSLDGGQLDLLPENNDESPSPSLLSSKQQQQQQQQQPNATIAAPTGSGSGSASNTTSIPIPDQKTMHHASQDSASQQIWIWTGIGFLDHILHALAKHAGWSLRVRAVGDLYIDDHHTTEDTFLALGSALSSALGARTGLRRFGSAHAPLDEALARAVVDVSSRPFCVTDFGFADERIGALATQMLPHGLQSFSQTAGLTLHVDVLRGVNDHHRAEAAVKALALALRDALEKVVGKEGEVVSTKGVL